MLPAIIKRAMTVILMLSFLSFNAGAQVSPVALQVHFDAPALVGKARLKVIFWDIYDASLIAPQGTFAKNKPFALELKYLRDFKGKEIASRSVDEMRNLGMSDEVKLAKWYQEMQDIFPNVKEGEMITGVVDAENVSHFYLNETPLGKVYDKEFSRWFFDIWLSEETSEPEMRRQLLGLEK
jgi:hypothetical protein